MKHWDGQDVAEPIAPRLSRRERRELAHLFELPAHRRTSRAGMGSLIGLGLALAVLAGLAWALAPGEPISPDLLN